VADLLERLVEELADVSESPDSEARWLLQEVAGHSTSQALSRAEIDEDFAREALSLAARRARGEPLQYVIGVAHFRYLDIAVGPGVLVPRPETELVVERAMELLPRGGVAVDVGTGSGAIALALKQERPDARVWATESSADALAWAERNRSTTGLEVELIRCDLLSGLPEDLRHDIDVVVSNPPYVAPEERALLPRDVRDHEPEEALIAPGDALSVIERLAEDARSWLRVHGWLVSEIGETLGPRVLSLLAELGYEEVSVRADLAGRDRIASARLPSRSSKEH
jgi:release factor glutamine methyltransferase